MAAYVIADATIHDMEKHRAAFLPAVDKLIADRWVPRYWRAPAVRSI